ncbi:MAG: SocA family protein [Candidatus Pacebacteria bacterium]|nr:SocA family protein [Candidatus Paceibacterota bacterium]
MTLNEKKYKNAVLYFIKYCNNQYLGATKLNKLFYYLDFINHRDRKESVTGDIYIHNHYGPTPSALQGVLSGMIEDDDIEVTQDPFADSHKKSFAIKKGVLDESVFSGEEKVLLRSVCGEFLDWSTDKIVEQTHLEAPWFYSKPLEKVNYEYSSDIEFFED